MTTREVARAFDTISPQYDDTRSPLEEETCRRLVEELRRAGAATLLEVGVGTGRVAAPLIARGLELTGLDPSLGMLGRAREKHVERLVRGDAVHLPFGDRAFDLTLFVHVLHLLEDPLAALREGARVSRLGSAALVEPAELGRPDPFDDPALNPRAIVYDELRRHGVALSKRTGGPRALDRALLDRFPPDRLVRIDERDVVEPLARELDAIARGASRWTLDVPTELLTLALAEARRRVGDRSVAYHRVWALAFWSAPRPTAPGRRGRGRASPTSRSGGPSRTAGRRPRGSSRPRRSTGDGRSR